VPGSGLAFTWTTISGATRYQLLIDKDGAPFFSQWVDGLTKWMPGLDFASGTYRWTVQPWSAAGFGLKSAPALFIVPITGAATPPTAIDPAGTLPGATGGTFNWTLVPGVRWYRLIIEREGDIYAVQWLDALNTWTPGFAFDAGTYQWKVQAWSPTGYGLVSNSLEFSYGVPSSSRALGLSAAATGTPVPAGLSSAAMETSGELEELPVSLETGANQEVAASLAVSAVSSQPSALKGMSAPETIGSPQDTHIQPLALEKIDAREDNDFKHLSAEDDSAISIAQTDGYVVSVGQGDGLTLQEISAAGSPRNDSGNQTTSADNQKADDGNLLLNQTEETDIDLVSAKMGYIAPIDIIVGPMNDPIMKQQFRLRENNRENRPDGTWQRSTIDESTTK
jgi:hypothetical protein